MVFRFVILFSVFLFACGVKGSPKPPPSIVPLEVQDIHVKQYSDKPLVYFTYDKKYKDELPIKEDISFVVYRNEKKINVFINSKGNLYWFLDSFEGNENCYKVVVKTKRKESIPSKIVCIKKYEMPKVELKPPKIKLTEEGFILELEDSYLKNIYKVENQQDFTPIPSYSTSENTFLDKNVELDKNYCYYYTLALAEGVETEKSPTVCSIFKDIFPPLPPERGKIIVEGNQATLIWEESKSKDVVGYLIYKNGKLLNPVPVKTYYFIDKDYKPSDEYSVVAVDRASNKSKELKIKNE
jgi:hypothetical protein